MVGTWGPHLPDPEPNGLQGLVNKGMADRDSHAPDVWEYTLTEEGRELFEAQAVKNQKKNQKKPR